MNLLELKNIQVHYGGVKALDGVNLNIYEGEILALMGPNGAGKSTVLKSIFGLAPVSEGEILWQGEKLKPLPHEVVARGIAFVPQGRRVFQHLTVEENLEISGVVIRDKRQLAQKIKEVMATFPVLKEKCKSKSGALSGGQQQMLALARGLMINPKLLLLDEPSLGLAPKIVKEIFEQIKIINQLHKTAIIVVEHNIKSLFDIASRACVLDKGKVILEGQPKMLMNNDIMEKVFLGAE